MLKEQQVIGEDTYIRWSNQDEFKDLKLPSHKYYIGLWTPGTIYELTEKERMTLDLMFMSSTGVKRGDWFYAFEIWRGVAEAPIVVFIADNGEQGFTAMLAREY